MSSRFTARDKVRTVPPRAAAPTAIPIKRAVAPVTLRPAASWLRPLLVAGAVVLLALVAALYVLAWNWSSPDDPGAGPIAIGASTRSIEPWRALLVAEEPAGAAVHTPPPDAAFAAPTGPHANLGLRRQAMWLRFDVVLADDAPRRWVLAADYPTLDRVDVFVARRSAAEPQHVAQLGDELVVAEREGGRTHATELELEPGSQRILVRVQTTSTMIVPLRLALPREHARAEAATEALQGVLAGIGVCLLVYSLAHGIALRDAAFGYYAASVAGVSIFFLAYTGLAPEHLWPHSAWLTAHAPPLSVLIAIWGGFLFLDATLRAAELSRVYSRVLRGFGWLALGCAIAFAAGAIDYRIAHTLATALGPLTMLLGLPLAWRRVKRGERVMGWLVAGWGAYGIGVSIMALLLRGLAPSNPITQHAFQIGATCEMAMWLALLGHRVQAIRRAGENAREERHALRSLALTDPLTGLANRRGLEVLLGEALGRTGDGRTLACFLIDLDGFKPVNDRHGHDAGDALLRGVAARLRQAIRRGDTVARLGGDEFVVVAEGVSSDAAAGEIGQKLLDVFTRPFELDDGVSCAIGLTIGYSLAPRDAIDPAALIKQADEAMYAGKQAGKGCCRAYRRSELAA